MPLLDHFHAPLKKHRHWESFHHAWATALATHLNRAVLPRQYVAEPHVKLGVEIESDVGTFEDEQGAGVPPNGDAVYAPPEPPLTLAVDFAGIDIFEVQIRDEDGPGDLVAAIELVSPANKNRPAHRRAFVTTCASYLQSGVSALVVDIATSRRANLHSDLLALLGHEAEGNGEALGELYAVAYRTITRRKRARVEAWPERLALGRRLPTLPLWLTVEQAVPVELEASYAVTCEALRLPRPSSAG